MIVLYWISGDPKRWKTFVSNRIGPILKAILPSQWIHVFTQESPANCATRSLTPSQLKHHKLWWIGLHWLHRSEEHWLANPILSPISELISEEQFLKHIGAHICIEMQRFIESYKLLFITAYVKRFIYNTRHQKADKFTGRIQVSQFQQAWFALVRMVKHRRIKHRVLKWMFRFFWKIWSADWLSHLQARPKWRHETDNLQRPDMIIIKVERTSPFWLEIRANHRLTSWGRWACLSSYN